MNRILKSVTLKALLVSAISIVVLALGGIPCAFAQNPTQNVALSPTSAVVATGGSVTLTANYNTSDTDNTLSGLTLNFHFDSTRLAFTGFSNVLATGLSGQETTPQDDTNNCDSDAATDKYVKLFWFDISGNWPGAGQTLPVVLAQAGFTALTTTGAAAVNVSAAGAACVSGTASGYDFLPTNATVTVSAPPTVTSVTPSSGIEAGGESVTIDGANFVATPTVTFGGVPASNVTFVSAAQLTCTTPAGTGTVDVVVTNPDTLSGTLAAGFTYNPPPTVTSVTPSTGDQAGGTSVTIGGSNFVATPTVTFGGVAATNVTFVSAAQLTCTTPAGTGTVNVVVTNPDTQSGTLTGGFTYRPPFGIIAPALPIDVLAGEAVAFSATGATNYLWTFSAGTPASASTQSVTWTAPATAATVAVSVADADNLTTTDSGTVNVYTQLAIDSKPTTTPTIQPGSSTTYTASGGKPADTTWTVTGPVAVAPGTGPTYVFTAPSTGAFAGVYTITAADGIGDPDLFTVKVPQKFTGKVAVKENAANVTWTVSGASAGTTYTWTVAGSTAYGTITGGAGAPSATFTWDVPNDVAATVAFKVTFTADDPDLVALNLETVSSPTIRVFNTRLFAGYVEDVSGGLGGATVEVLAPAQYVDVTQTVNLGGATDGYFSFTLPVTGSLYYFIAYKDGYVAQEFTSSALSSDDPALNIIRLAVAAANAYISGTTSQARAKVQAIYEDLVGEPVLAGKITSSAASIYRIDFAADPGAAAYTMTATNPGFFVETAAAAPLPITGVALNLAGIGANTVNALAGGSSALTTVAGVNISIVQVPFNTLDRTAGATANIGITPTTNDDPASFWTQASGAILYEVFVPNLLPGKYAEVTIPFDLAVVGPGGFESGAWVIYHAPTKADLLAGTNVSSVSPADIIDVDYLGDGETGLVTFRAYSFSAFGVGAAGAAAAAAEEGSSGGCFIATTAGGAWQRVFTFPLAGMLCCMLLLGYAFVRRNRRKDG